VGTTFFGMRRSNSSHMDLHAPPAGGGIPASRSRDTLRPPMAPSAGHGQQQGHGAAVPPVAEFDLRGGGMQRTAKHIEKHGNLLDRDVLQTALQEAGLGTLTFLEAFNISGRVLNICVTRSDGKAEALLCNYLTTPHMCVNSGRPRPSPHLLFAPLFTPSSRPLFTPPLDARRCVYSACLASCAIPGVFEAVELLAKA
jgi:hypothetical protein